MSADPVTKAEFDQALDGIVKSHAELLGCCKMFSQNLDQARTVLVELRRDATTTAERDRLNDKIEGVDLARRYWQQIMGASR